MKWQPIKTAPTDGSQFLVTDDVDLDDLTTGYGTIELVNDPFLKNGKILNQNSGNYTNPSVWKWWFPVPPKLSKEVEK